MTLNQTRRSPAATGLQIEQIATSGTEYTALAETANAFLKWLDPEANSFCFRTFPDTGTGPGRNYTGSLQEHAAALAADNAAGRGVFVVVNQGGHRSREIARVRSCFADLDGAPLDPVTAFDLQPHMAVESSAGRFHAYWLLADDMPPAQFKPMQQAIAARFSSDPSVCDLPRVMRLPGFIHHKGAPFVTRVIQWNERARCTNAELLQAFPPVPRQQAPAIEQTEGETIDTGRHDDVVRLSRKLVLAGLNQGEAVATLEAMGDAGRWSREMAPDEIARAVAGALDHLAHGEWSLVVDPADVFGKQVLPPGAFATAAPRFVLTPARELLKTPEPLKWLVRGFLLPATSSMLVGDPATGKSLIAIDWAACVALGREWNGRSVAQGFVVYLAGEGHHGIARRLKAWSLAHGAGLEDAPLVVSDYGASLSQPASLSLVLEAIDAAAVVFGTPALVVVDTLHRNLGADENSAADTAAYFQAVDTIRTRYAAHVLTVHHSGHGDKSRARGSSSLRGGVDTDMVLSLAGDIRTLIMPKQKDGPKAAPMHFQLHEIPLPWIDAEGEPETSVVLLPSLATPSSAPRLTPSQRLALDTLRDCGDGPVSLETWRVAFYERHTGDSAEAKRQAFHRVRANLLDAALISVNNDDYKITDQRDMRDIAVTCNAQVP